jgi:hypothetical protein
MYRLYIKLLKNYIKFFYIHKFDIIFNNFLVILEVLILPIYNLKTSHHNHRLTHTTALTVFI